MNRKNGLRQNFIKNGGGPAYDKKLLWRANLYIDEGANDWNNKNPWTSAQGNEWDIDDRDADNDGNRTEPGNGGQVVHIPDWTRFIDRPRNRFMAENATETESRSPYTSGGFDSPFAVVRELNEQRAVLNYNTSGGWSTTTAPNGTWNNYYPTSVSNRDPTWTVGDDWVDVRIDGIIQHPYRPNLSAVALYGNFYQADGVTTIYDIDRNRFVRQSTGVDCSGFTQRCASYINNRYTLTDIEGDVTWDYTTDSDTEIGHLRGSGGIPGYADLIYSDDVAYPTGEKDIEILENTELTRIVPGDVISMYDREQRYYPHIVVILAIYDPDGNGRPRRKDIVLIEAASGFGTNRDRYCVLNNQTLWGYKEQKYTGWVYNIMRLRQR